MKIPPQYRTLVIHPLIIRTLTRTQVYKPRFQEHHLSIMSRCWEFLAYKRGARRCGSLILGAFAYYTVLPCSGVYRRIFDFRANYWLK
jgi:hypothetical protein